MSEETVKQEIETEEEPRTFSQEEVNRIVGERVARVEGKYADYDSLKAKASKFDEMEEANKTELQKATEKADALQAELNNLKKAETIRQMREKVSSETGVPVSLITAETEEAAMEQANAIKDFAKPGYPRVNDSGETNPVTPRNTAQQFAEWFDAVSNN